MQRTVKLGLVMLLLILALSLCAACMGTARIAPDGGFNFSNINNPGVNKGLSSDLSNNENRVIEGYIVSYDNNRITVDQVEFLTTSHSERIKELGLDVDRDFAHGYYVVNDGQNKRITLPVASSVQVRFANSDADGLYDGSITEGLRQGVALNSNGATGTDANRVLDGTLPNNTNNNTAANDHILRHLGHTFGGVAGGVVGGLEMLARRFTGYAVLSGERVPYFITIENGYVTGIEEAHAFSNFAGTAGQGINTKATLR